MSQQIEWMIELFGQERAVRRFRKHAIGYLRDLPNSAVIKNRIVRLPNACDVLSTLEEYLFSLPNTPTSCGCTHGESASAGRDELTETAQGL